MDINKLVREINEEEEIETPVSQPKKPITDLKSAADSEPDVDTQLASHKDEYIKNILQTAVGGNKAAGLRMYDAYKESGKDFKSFLQGMIETIKKSGVLYSHSDSLGNHE